MQIKYVLLLALLVLAACETSEISQDNIDQIIQVNQGINTVAVESTLEMTVSADGMTIPLSTQLSGEVDHEQNLAQGTITVSSMLTGKQEMEFYSEGNTLYMYEELMGWVESEQEEFTQSDYDENLRILETADTEITELMQGDNSYYRVDAQIDADYVLELLLGEDDETVQEIMGDEDTNPIRNYSMTILVNKDTLYIEESTVELDLVIVQDEQQLEMQMASETQYFDHNQPVNIQRPEGIESATSTESPSTDVGAFTGAAISEIRT